MAYDGADRHVATLVGDNAVVYTRDATDRLVSRQTTALTYVDSSKAAATAPVSDVDLAKPPLAGVGDPMWT